jgi:hypothetical protein
MGATTELLDSQRVSDAGVASGSHLRESGLCESVALAGSPAGSEPALSVAPSDVRLEVGAACRETLDLPCYHPSNDCVGYGLPNGRIVAFDVADATRMPIPDQRVGLVFGSPPYLGARTYGIGAQRGLKDWVDFMLAVTREGLRVSRGLVCWVVAGCTENKVYQPGPEALLYEAWRAGIECWRPACWHKVDPITGGGTGQPGSGGKQWLRSDWEYVLAFKNLGPLPYADPTFQKRAPKYGPGGTIRTRHKDGSRVMRAFKQPGYVNPGNAIAAGIGEDEASGIVRARVGGGHQGDAECHESEAPFPEALASFFIRGWCAQGDWVYDPFSGSGTTAVVAGYHNRNGFGTDIRLSQVDLASRRMARRLAGNRACPSLAKLRDGGAA